MLNIDTPTLGGKYCWNTIQKSNGFKLQQNKFTSHYRILDSSNIRRAWSFDRAEIDDEFDSLTRGFN